MAIEMNFGWLNDYTGSKFAPITLANLVLMETSNGTTETLYDYVEDRIIGFEDLAKNLQDSVEFNKEQLYLLLQDQPVDKNNDKIKTAKAAQRAVMLVSADSKGDVNILDENGDYNPEVFGLKMGSLVDPIYFDKGIPAKCQPSKLDSIPVKYKKYNTTNNQIETESDNFSGKDTSKDVTIWATSALNVDIRGVAQFADTAKTSYFAKEADFANVTGASIQLLKDADIGGKLDVNDNQYHNYITQPDGTQKDMGLTGDIYGTIKTSDLSQVSSLNLKNIWYEYEADKWQADYNNETTNQSLSFGVEYATDATKEELQKSGKISIPSFKIDKTGRIVAAKETISYAGVQLKSMGESGYKQAYLMGFNKGSDITTYISSQGSNLSNSIYFDWSADDGEPVLMGAAWNDYAEYRKQKETIEPGYCVKSNDDGRVEKTTERLSICDGIVSDTFGFSIGKHADYETPLAVSGRVLAYCEGSAHDYHAGDVVCASENGKVCVMTREEIKEYPDRIVGTVSEIPSYDNWNGKKINGRIWIKVK